MEGVLIWRNPLLSSHELHGEDTEIEILCIVSNRKLIAVLNSLPSGRNHCSIKVKMARVLNKCLPWVFKLMISKSLCYSVVI